MDHISPTSVLDIIGASHFSWLAKQFDKTTALKDIPDTILNRFCDVDVAKRDFSGDQNGMTSIALITFAYQLAGKMQKAQYGPKDMMFLKVLAKKEQSRREKNVPLDDMWDAPLYELITGPIGDRVREMKMMTDPGGDGQGHNFP